MKKMVFCLLTLLTCGVAHALPFRNPAEASLLCDGLFLDGSCCYDWCDSDLSWCDAFSVRFGYDGNFVFNRHLEVDASYSGADIDNTEICTNAGYVVANLYDRFDLYATFGATNFRIESNASAFGGPTGARLVLESETDFSYSIGFRATIFEWGCTSYGIETEYFYTRPNLKCVSLEKDFSAYPASNIHMKYREWQIGIGVAHRINNIVPYFGAKYSRGQMILDGANVLLSSGGGTLIQNILIRDLETKWNGGYVLGISFIDCEKMALSVEGRWPDEKSLSVNGHIRF
ncbi:MAG: hypothetical protein KDK55_05040 [Chlamydiia bacterium]|nr:hypothetical protein [Chlamydiia bacterium]